jgi:hypothetical protein
VERPETRELVGPKLNAALLDQLTHAFGAG